MGEFSKFIFYYRVFKKFTGRKLYILVGLIVLASLTEGIGFSLFAPLFTIITDGGFASSNNPSLIERIFSDVFNFFGLPSTLTSLSIILAVVFLVKGLLTFIQEIATAFITKELVQGLRMQTLEKYNEMSYEYYLEKESGYLSNIIIKEIERMVAAFGRYAQVIVSIINIIIFAILSAIVSWKISLAGILAALILLLPMRLISKSTNKYSSTTSEKNAALQQLLSQSVDSLKYLKATNQFHKIRVKLKKEISSLATLYFKIRRNEAIISSSKDPITIYIILGLLAIQLLLFGGDVGVVMVLLLLFYRMMNRFYILLVSWQAFNANIGGVDTFVSNFDEATLNKETKGGKNITKINLSIRLEDINLNFGDFNALKNINIEIPKDKMIAIVGESGAGKSTIVDLICGLIKPSKGSIYVDQFNYKNINIDSLRSMIGFVAQETIIFNDSVENNISLWDLGNKDKIREVAKSSNAEEFILSKEDQYQTIVGDRGEKLSGGQRQRISIARELFKEPEFLILDEATSALDTKTENKIRGSIESLQGTKTILVISHRISTIKNADYIYLIHKGIIEEEGTYDYLYNLNNRFRKMCDGQEI
tara:strand:+ start:861 stop:2639 length:1779 start_codon:yes stop_codon:yes gene_type:complete